MKAGAYLLLFSALELAVWFIRNQRPEERLVPVRINCACLCGMIPAARFSLVWFSVRVIARTIRVIAAAAGAG